DLADRAFVVDEDAGGLRVVNVGAGRGSAEDADHTTARGEVASRLRFHFVAVEMATGRVEDGRAIAGSGLEGPPAPRGRVDLFVLAAFTQVEVAGREVPPEDP